MNSLFANSNLPMRQGESSDVLAMHQGALLRPTQVPGQEEPIPCPCIFSLRHISP